MCIYSWGFFERDRLKLPDSFFWTCFCHTLILCYKCVCAQNDDFCCFLPFVLSIFLQLNCWSFSFLFSRPYILLHTAEKILFFKCYMCIISARGAAKKNTGWRMTERVKRGSKNKKNFDALFSQYILVRP